MMKWLAFLMIPIVWIVVWVFTRDCTIIDIYNDWKEHVESGEAWCL